MKQDKFNFTILFVDDEKQILSSLKRTFFDEPYSIHTAATAERALEIVASTAVHVMFMDLKMPGTDGLSLLKIIRKNFPEIIPVMLTGHGSIPEAVEALRNGAADFMEKPFVSDRLRSQIRQYCRLCELDWENRKLKAEIKSQFYFDEMIGHAAPFLKLKGMISQIAPSDLSVMILGETGSGKELVAKAIHHHSGRKHRKFVPVDCASISETILKSELFGHEKGAFTGAFEATKGLIRSADKGTLFFDEIGELPLQMQATLLRTIQEQEVRPVGSTRCYPVDVRIIAATNLDIQSAIKAKAFREDLYYRLTPIILHVPPLRDRKEDIPFLANAFIQRFGTDSSTIKGIDVESMALLENYSWPGNVRELENVIRRAMAIGRQKQMMPNDLPKRIMPLALTAKQPSTGDTLEDYEKAAICNALAKAGKHRKKTADILGIGEATLYRKLRKYGQKLLINL